MVEKLLSLLVFTLIAFNPVRCTEDEPPPELPLLGDSFYPESCLALPDGKSLVIGGFGDGSIQIVNIETQEATYFAEPGSNGLVQVVGFDLDTTNNVLWASNIQFAANGLAGGQLKAFDLATQELLQTIPANFTPGAFLNQVVMDGATPYVTDTQAPIIWTVEDGALIKFVEDDLLMNPAPDQFFGLNGMTLVPGYLIASSIDQFDAGGGRLVRIGLEDRQVTEITLKGEDVALFAGCDGSVFDPVTGLLFMTNIYADAGGLFTADFNSDFTEATLKLRTDREFAFPTGVAVTDGTVWIVEGQLDHLFDFGNGAFGTPPALPFQVVNEAVEDLAPEFFTPSPTLAPTPAPTSAPTSASTSGVRGNVWILGAGFLALGLCFY